MPGGGLLAACRRGDYEFIKSYTRRHLKAHSYRITDNHCWGPLHHAVYNNSLACVELLLSLGNLVDVRAQTFEGQTCLIVGIVHNASSDIIRTLLRHDPELFNLPNHELVFPILMAVQHDNIDLVRVLISTMAELGHPIPHQIDLENEHSLHYAVRQRNEEMIYYLMEHTQVRYKEKNVNGLTPLCLAMVPSDAPPCPHNVLLRIVEKLFPHTHDIADQSVMDELMMPMALCCHFKNHRMYTWFMDKFYLTEFNEHRELVRRALVMPCPDDNEYKKILLGLHSRLPMYVTDYDDSWRNDLLYKRIWHTLCAIYHFKLELFREITAVLTNKLHAARLNVELFVYLPKEHLDPSTATHFVRMFDIMGAASKLDLRQIVLDIEPVEAKNIAYALLMPFSSAPMAPMCAVNYMQTLRNDDASIGGAHCNNLMSLCRTVIRDRILTGNESFAVKLDRFRALELPESLLNFILFNYTSYVFSAKSM